MIESEWLICPNCRDVKRFSKSLDNKDRFNEYIFIDSGIVKVAYGN